MATPEKVNLLVMRDNGEVRSVRIRRRLFLVLAVLCAIMPFVAGAGLWLSYTLWTQQAQLNDDNLRLTRESQEARAKAERLGNLEQLLQRSAATEAVLASNVHKAQSQNGEAVGPPAPLPTDEQAALQEGPGHSEFPAINTGFVTLENVSARQQPGSRLRISLDLRNPDARKTLSGEVSASLVTAAGESVPLQFRPNDAGDFRIARLKRAVLVSLLPPQTNFTNAQVVIEVKSDAGELVYRNVFPVEQ